MAKLGSYYGLCPLIDQNSLLGVSEDKEIGHVIVTLGKNIAIKYRLSDQKQIQSWRTKDKFTSPVLYDKKQEKYVAIFNHLYVRVWDEDEEYIDKLKKLKFNAKVHTIVTCGGNSFIVFNNGFIADLHSSIENRSNLDVIDAFNAEESTISEVFSLEIKDEVCIGLMVKSSETDFIWSIFGEEGLKTNGKIRLERGDYQLIGQVLAESDYEGNFHFLTLWSDGKLFSSPLNQSTSTFNSFAFLDSLSSKHAVSMSALNQHYVAMYGAKPNDEGAALILFSTQFRVTQTRQLLKLYSEGAQIWKVENQLLLPIGQNLAVVPFHLETEQLAALIGSRRIAPSNDADVTIVEEVQTANWVSNEYGVKKFKLRKVPKADIDPKIRARFLELHQDGLSEVALCSEIITNTLQENDAYTLSVLLDHMRNIPELFIAKMMKFALSAPATTFNKTLGDPIEKTIPAQLKPALRFALLEKITSIPFSDVLLLPHVRSLLDLSNVFCLIDYITFILSSDVLITSVEKEQMLLDWGCLLLDASYQKFLLSNDSTLLNRLTKLNAAIGWRLDGLKNMQVLEPMLLQIVKGKGVGKIKSSSNVNYSVEQLKLY